MSSVPTSITSALESISTSCGDVIRDVGEFTPSVMAPETLVLNNHDKIRTVFDAVTFTGGPEADLTPEQEADNAISALSTHANAVTRIAEKIAATMFSVAASDRALIESAVQFKTNAMQAKVKTATDCIEKQVATAIRVEQKRVRDSDKGDYHLLPANILKHRFHREHSSLLQIQWMKKRQNEYQPEDTKQCAVAYCG